MSYVDQRFYDDLVSAFSSWDIESNSVSDAKVRDQCRMLLEREARLLDQARYDEWLAMYTPQCAYWVPATPAGGDPRREVAVMFDDRRRLEDRVYRLKTGYAWSQAPASRTVRLVSNVEVFSRGEDLMVRSNFLISEFRSGETRFLSGWCAHRLAEGKIAVKQVNLIDCDQNLRNPSLVL
jgi:3-phenylpropionate/cinnamic acid dioxygenase small subunit